MMKILKAYWPTMIVVGVIIYATWLPHSLPAGALPPVAGLDKLIHAVMMGGLAGALMFDFYRSGHQLTLRAIVGFTLAAAAFSVVDEYVQGLLPIDRPSDLLDLLADWVGCVVAAFAAPPAVKAVVKRRP